MHIQKSSWYKEPWFFGVIFIVFISVLFSSIIFFVSLRLSNDLVSDNYYQDGKNIFKEIDKENKARKLNIVGKLYIKDNNILNLIMDGDLKDKQLRLEFIHPFLKSKDKEIILIQSDKNLKLYTGEFKDNLFDINHWYIHLCDMDGNWIIRGKWIVKQGSIVLLAPVLEKYKYK